VPQVLLNAEVAELVKRVAFGEDAQQQVVQKTLEYVERFRKYNNIQARLRGLPSANRAGSSLLIFANVQAITSIRETLQSKELSQYELAALANLCLDSVEEAKALIPTLADGRFEDENEVPPPPLAPP
jgi:hypothetical protein